MDPETTKPIDEAAPTPEPEVTAQSAFEAGLATVTPEPEPEPKPEPEAEEPAAEAEAEAPEAAEPPAAPDPVDEEISSLSLNERSAARFRELSKSEKALVPIREAAEKAGVKLEDLPQVFARAQERDEFVRMVSETGATPEQFGKLLDYQTSITAASRGDLKAAEAAFEMLLPEVQALAGLLGKEIPGIVDPLADHADLRSAVEDGDLNRERALELARLRTQGKLQESTRTQQDTQARAEQERAEGVQWLNQFEAHMRANDPNYEARRPALVALVESISATVPPKQWAQIVQNAYSRMPAPPVAQPKPTPGPMRPRQSPGVMTPERFDSPMAAFEHGLSQA